jgi:hypothetical protein
MERHTVHRLPDYRVSACIHFTQEGTEATRASGSLIALLQALRRKLTLLLKDHD